jgi:hypothetical protein
MDNQAADLRRIAFASQDSGAPPETSLIPERIPLTIIGRPKQLLHFRKGLAFYIITDLIERLPLRLR